MILPWTEICTVCGKEYEQGDMVKLPFKCNDCWGYTKQKTTDTTIKTKKEYLEATVKHANSRYKPIEEYNLCEHPDCVEIDEVKFNKKDICLYNVCGTIKPIKLKDYDGFVYNCFYKPEYDGFFELRPEDKDATFSFKDYLHIIEAE